MSTKSINWEILLIYFLLLIPWPPSQVVKMVCSRDSSRLVRKIVRSKWTPILDKHHVKLPLECPLHPLRDLYSPRQDAKKRDRPTQWTCRLCGKSFYQEKFLDLHFETRHKSIINVAEDSICLADFCDIMRCDVFQTEESMSLKIGDQHIVTDIEVWGDSLGQNSALAKANAAYLSLLPLRSSSVGATRAAKIQSRQEQFSQSSTVKEDSIRADATSTTIISVSVKENQSKRKEDRQSSKRTDESSTKQSKGSTDNQQAPVNSKGLNDKGEATQESGNTTTDDGDRSEKPENGNATNSQKIRANCKAEELSKLKSKCEFLVRSCIGSLLLSMTDQSFREMEEEMNKAVCWYLTCDRYWEDGPLEPRAFPWGLILILVFILSTGICFCYYIIWILFDSEETTINTGINHHQMYLPPHQQHQYYPAYEYLGGPQQPQSQPPPPPPVEGVTISQYQYYQQQGPQSQTADIYHEPQRYEYRHSPRRYIGDQRQPLLPTQTSTVGTGMSSMTASAVTTTSGVGNVSAVGQGQTPLHHHHHHHHPTGLAYQQDILDRRDYTSRPIATTAVSSSGVSGSGIGIGIGSSSSATNLAASTVGSSASSVGKPHYNTHPRPLASQHRHVGASQQSLRGSSSTHEIIQNEVGQNEHYIYVTYPPDLKKRFFEKYE